MLLVMSTAGIFDEEECNITANSQSSEERKTHKRTDSEIHKYSALWQVTWERIDCFLPNLRQELFTPRSQTPAANVRANTESDKAAVEETKPVQPDLPQCPVEGKICGVTLNQCKLSNRELSLLRQILPVNVTQKIGIPFRLANPVSTTLHF